MLDVLDIFYNREFLFVVFAALASFATIIALALPYMSGDKRETRMKAMAIERDRMRTERIAELAAERGTLRQKPKSFMNELLDTLKVKEALDSEAMREKLKMAGFRGQGPVIAFMFFRVVMPIIALLVSAFYLFVVLKTDLPPIVRIVICLASGYAGFYLPNLFVQNQISKRQLAIKRAFPDSLDLLLICVQSGMSIEAAFARVAKEVGNQSIELAEELTLTTAELSYLQDRRQAYENLGKRTGLPGVKAVATSLIQAERYGTPVGQALRVMAQENREMRMAEAEKKAAALPPKLTVPMICFFLPVIFLVILGPSGIRLMQQFGSG